MLFEELDTYLNALPTPTDEKRIELLDSLVHYLKTTKEPELVFVCTHNSRRSQLSQIWAHVLADHYDIELTTYSAGTEATAFNIRAVDSLRRCGFDIEPEEETIENPIYLIRYSSRRSRLHTWSKTIDDLSIPQTGFAALMTCAEADEQCPVMLGCDLRVPLRYEDPKEFDDTDREVEFYDIRCRHIASDLNYVMKATSGQS